MSAPSVRKSTDIQRCLQSLYIQLQWEGRGSEARISGAATDGVTNDSTLWFDLLVRSGKGKACGGCMYSVWSSRSADVYLSPTNRSTSGIYGPGLSNPGVGRDLER